MTGREPGGGHRQGKTLAAITVACGIALVGVAPAGVPHALAAGLLCLLALVLADATPRSHPPGDGRRDYACLLPGVATASIVMLGASLLSADALPDVPWQAVIAPPAAVALLALVSWPYRTSRTGR
ncbi:hypothetical protein [Haloechinothrix sp. LS1_15]|uniref:hypothetical protein n=1 Tax=Haloechinothrix sp. LS1_15 TaxID=2652248 RepID=UPI0029464354|nr:hypothetical protein [Haloechinothrix sp. LS1_15]MDV6014448.1 hypothetical protein [Haloechinothrix sp. LS1_15]